MTFVLTVIEPLAAVNLNALEIEFKYFTGELTKEKINQTQSQDNISINITQTITINTTKQLNLSGGNNSK